MNIYRTKFLFSVVVILFAFGCGDGKIAITGKISCDGVVPEKGTIAFIGDGGAGTTYGEPYKNGTYSVRLPEGKYRVRITGTKTVQLDTPIPSDMGRPPITEQDESVIHDSYGLASKLTVDITKSTKTQDFILEAPEEE